MRVVFTSRDGPTRRAVAAATATRWVDEMGADDVASGGVNGGKRKRPRKRAPGAPNQQRRQDAATRASAGGGQADPALPLGEREHEPK